MEREIYLMTGRLFHLESNLNIKRTFVIAQLRLRRQIEGNCWSIINRFNLLHPRQMLSLTCCIAGEITAIFNLMCWHRWYFVRTHDNTSQTSEACVCDWFLAAWSLISWVFLLPVELYMINKRRRWLTQYSSCRRDGREISKQSKRKWLECPTFFPFNEKWKSDPCPNNRHR